MDHESGTISEFSIADCAHEKGCACSANEYDTIQYGKVLYLEKVKLNHHSVSLKDCQKRTIVALIVKAVCCSSWIQN